MQNGQALDFEPHAGEVPSTLLSSHRQSAGDVGTEQIIWEELKKRDQALF